MGVSILLGSYNVLPPNPCCLRTDLVRGLCFINTRPELTRIRGGQRGEWMLSLCKFVINHYGWIREIPPKCFWNGYTGKRQGFGFMKIMKQSVESNLSIVLPNIIQIISKTPAHLQYNYTHTSSV